MNEASQISLVKNNLLHLTLPLLLTKLLRQHTYLFLLYIAIALIMPSEISTSPFALLLTYILFHLTILLPLLPTKLLSQYVFLKLKNPNFQQVGGREISRSSFISLCCSLKTVSFILPLLLGDKYILFHYTLLLLLSNCCTWHCNTLICLLYTSPSPRDLP